MGDGHEICNTRLGLGIGLDDFVPKRDIQQQKNGCKRVICLDLSFPLNFKDGQEMEIGYKTEGSSSKTVNIGEEERQSTTSNNMNDDHNNDNNGGVRKKLRLNKEQSTVLEDTFKQHTTLNTAQKQALAEKLNLKPRQVEVWFQNRRARTKLKQTEVDCEFLKKCCENLSDENRRLKKEVQQLRSSFENMDKEAKTTTSTPFFVQLQKTAATIAMCPSCEKMVRSKGSCGGDIVKHERSMAAAAAANVAVHYPKHKQSGLNFLT